MLRIKSKNISIQLIVLVTLCLLFGLMMCLSLPPAYAAERREQPCYVVDAYQTPGVVYRIVNREPDDFFGRRSGSISSIALCNGQLYFCSANDRRIYQRIEERERVVFKHRIYVRDIAVDSNGNLHFSEASGAGDDGRIYKLSPRVNELGREGRFFISSISRKDPVQVRLSTVDKFWAGDFTFDARGDLYLSTGNHTPAFIYKVPRIGSDQYGPPRSIYRDSRAAIKGIAIEPNIRDPNNPIFIYYADWERSIHILNIRDLGRSIAFSFPEENAQSGNRHLSDIAFDIIRP